MTVAAVVLAAGASRRLGQPKQLLALDGATVLDATLAVARDSGARPSWWSSAVPPTGSVRRST